MVQSVPQLGFGNLGGKEAIGDFDGGDISSDGGVMLLAEAENKLGLIERLAALLGDDRDPNRVRHSTNEMLRQRVFQICCGYEDCNDADDLRFDPAFKAAVGRLPQSGDDLASQPTLSRLENSVGPRELYRISELFIDLFIAEQGEPPERVVLDIDATDDPTHGQQQFAAFDGHYGQYCYVPLIVTARADDGPDQLLAAVLRAGKSHGGHRALAVLSRIVDRLREAWPEVRIVLRADGGFAKPEIYNWCEGEDTDEADELDDADAKAATEALDELEVEYLISLPKNSRVAELAEPHLEAARAEFEATGEKVRRLHAVRYAAGSWPHERRVLVKAEVTEQGDNPRYVVTNMRGGPLVLYDFYARRGDAENRIKELKCDLAMDRTSCHSFLANQFRLLLHAAAFVLLSFVRRCLAGTEFATAQVCTLQRRFLKLGVLVRESCRRVCLHFASSCPVRWLWPKVLARLRA